MTEREGCFADCYRLVRAGSLNDNPRLSDTAAVVLHAAGDPMEILDLHADAAALRRLEDGSYGDCFECGDEISEARLRALPFAVRCKECEEARETAEQRERLSQRRSSSAFLFDTSN